MIFFFLLLLKAICITMNELDQLVFLRTYSNMLQLNADEPVGRRKEESGINVCR